MGCSVKLKWLDCIIIISAVISAMLYPQRRSLRILLMNQKNTLNITSQANTSFLIFNRNPKAASQTIWKLLDKLQNPNHFYSSHDSFEVKKLVKGEKVYLPKEEQEIYINMFMDESRQVPYTYSKHINFINFQEFGLQNPIYINFVREPVDKVISWYYYRRQNWYMLESTDALKEGSPFEFPALLKMTFEDCVHQRLPECTFDIGSSIHYGPNGGNHISQVRITMAFLRSKGCMRLSPFQISFFCGMHKVCDDFGSPEALEMAKSNVDRYYAVVGVVEKMQESLQVLENYVPAYFRYATRVYNGMMKEERVNLNKGKPQVPESIKQIIRQNFTLEMEFYEYCKRRLGKQFLALK